MTRKVLSVQNISCETLGTFNKFFQSEGYHIKKIKVPRDPVPKDAGEYLAVIILGGPMSVYERLSHLEDEQSLIRDAIRKNIPVLGICLGSQLIAQATGGRVYKGIQKEIGWYTVNLTDDGLNSLFKGAEHKQMQVFQWHGDTYDLPSDATVLAYSDLYPQEFRIGSAFGVQFHLEVSNVMIRRWILVYKKELEDDHLKAEDVIPLGKKETTDLFDKCKLVFRNFSSIISNRSSK
jgi:GMP synthase-like glutamine amidotransferase